MTSASGEAAHHGYAVQEVPDDAQGSGWRIFFIVAGSLCGLPVFILSARVFGSLGFRDGVAAVLIGTVISAALGAASAYTGSRSRRGLAMLADHGFGALGATIVKLVIAVSLIGWFGVGISVLGTTVADALTRMTGHAVPPLVIGLPVCVGIVLMTLTGATGLERLGKILVPLTALILAASVAMVWSRTGTIWRFRGSGTLDFADCVSAVVGSYIVGIVIQPDYGRFVRRPIGAAVGAGAALGIAFPLVLVLASVAALSLGVPHLISALIALGVGLPALAVLLLGAWIDASACLYSASLSIANLLPRVSFRTIVVTIALFGMALVVTDAQAAFVPFLVTLGIALPPLATILVLAILFLRVPSSGRSSAMMAAAWVTGTAIGFMTSNGILHLTGLPTLDSIACSAAAFALVLLARPMLSGA